MAIDASSGRGAAASGNFFGNSLRARGSDMRKLVYRFRRDEEGAALVEYGMLVGLIAVICVAAVTLLGNEISQVFSTIASDLVDL